MSAELTARMRNMATEHGLTLAAVVQGAWALLLSLYTGKTDILLGVTVAGRPPLLAGADTIVGLFINTLPLRVDLDPATKVVDWLRKIQASQIAAQQFGVYKPRGYPELEQHTAVNSSVSKRSSRFRIIR